MNIQNYMEFSDFSLGLDLITSSMHLDKRSLADCVNFELTPKRGLSVRGGITKLTAGVFGAIITDIFNYRSTYGNMIVGRGGEFLKIYNNGAWTTLKSGYSSGYRMSFAQMNDVCYAVDGYAPNVKILNTTAYNVGVDSPASAPNVSLVSGSLTGRFAYVYVYYSTIFNTRSVPSQASSIIEPSGQGVQVSYVASSDPQIDKIEIYRTYSLGASEEPATFYFVTAVNNTTDSYIDNIPDADLGLEVSWDYYKPPKAKYLAVYKNRMFYANCPSENYGDSLVVYSEINNPDAIADTNYEYFDRGDGEAITGIASLPDYLIVFKPSKFYIISGDFELKRLVTSKYDIGCIASYAIIQLEDKVIFLSKQGWFSFNGENLINISKTIADKLINDGYISENKIKYWSGTYYPAKNQIRFLFTGSGLEPYIFVGTFLLPFLNISEPLSIFNFPIYVSWTKFNFPNHNLSCLASYLDVYGETKTIAGSEDGYIYVLDSGTTDDEQDINVILQSGWFNASPVIKERGWLSGKVLNSLIRYFEINYYTSGEHNLNLILEKDFTSDQFRYSLAGIMPYYCGFSYCGETYCGAEAQMLFGKATPALLTGSLFRFLISGSTNSNFTFNELLLFYRSKGIRPRG